MVKVHFDIEGSVEECQAFLNLIGFPVSTADDQNRVNALAQRLVIANDKLVKRVSESTPTT